MHVKTTVFTTMTFLDKLQRIQTNLVDIYCPLKFDGGNYKSARIGLLALLRVDAPLRYSVTPL